MSIDNCLGLVLCIQARTKTIIQKQGSPVSSDLSTKPTFWQAHFLLTSNAIVTVIILTHLITSMAVKLVVIIENYYMSPALVRLLL